MWKLKEYVSKPLLYLGIGLLMYTSLSCPSHAQDKKESSMPLYHNGRIYIPPRKPPEKSLQIYRSEKGDFITIYTDVKRDNTRVTNQSQKLRDAVKQKKETFNDLLRQLKDKGYIK
ncbi:MAG: hypothetical protein NT120_01210 [Candidatus Aenigmarchaeota archaeon]|nr:hypothetical protein [Candidatus Aenigmarchaeota archaeon]